MNDGDAKGLLAATHEIERSCSHLDETTLRHAWEILVQPQITRSKLVRFDDPLQTSNEVQATAVAHYVDDHGDPWQLTMIANQAEGGPKATVLVTMLMSATSFDANGRRIAHRTLETRLAGIKRFGPQLENLGIPRILLNPSRCLSWDELEAHYSEQISIAKAAKGVPPVAEK